ncbi:MAG: hypothetical protein QHC90_29795 [Shinella sp.]|jgi:hypothetical protein|nr:hypothetical protein [Shinella sp.]
MARYYFDLDDEDGVTRDDTGIELPDREVVPIEVARILSDVSRDELPKKPNGSMTVYVRDENGFVIYTGSLRSESGWL